MTDVVNYAAASKSVDIAMQNMISAIERLATARAYAMGSKAEAPRFGEVAAANAADAIERAQVELRAAEAVLAEYRSRSLKAVPNA